MYKHPKRRRSKDNPYELEIIKNRYFVKFLDSKKELQIIEINKTIWEKLNQFELEDIRQLNQYERHIEHSEIYEETLYHRAFNKDVSIDSTVITKIMIENLYNAINLLSDVQKSRIKNYYFDDMTLDEIAALEKTTHQAISKNLKISIMKIKKMISV